MRIVYVTSTLPYGPSEAFILPEIMELRRQGHEVLVVPMLPRGEVVHAGARELLGATVATGLGSRAVLATAARELVRHPRRAARCLAWCFEGRSPRIVLKNLAVVPKALWLAALVRARRVDHLHAHWAATSASLAMFAGEIAGVPWSFTAHRWDIPEDNLLGRKLRHAVMARFISEKTRQMVRAIGLEPPATSAVLHMGVRLPGSHAAPAGPAVPPPVILCPGTLERRKGQGYLVEAFAQVRARVPGAQLWLAGTGPAREALEAKVAALGLGDAVRFLGHLPQHELLAFYAQGRVGLVTLASIEEGFAHEGIPVALIEAMSYGVPVVGAATGGIPELLGDGAGVLVPQQDAGALAEALAGLLADPDHARRVGEQGRRRVGERFAIGGVMTEMIARLEGRHGGAA